MEKLRIELYSVDNGIRAAVRGAFNGNGYSVLEVTDSAKFSRDNVNEERQEGTIGRLNLPDNVDFVVTRSALNRRVEGLAASLGLRQGRNDVFAVVLPQALNFLRDQLDKRGNLVLVGADQAR